MILEILKQAKDENKIISIHTYDDDKGFWSGRVKNFNEFHVVLEHYTKYGKSDGILIEEVSNISSIDFGDGYCEMMEYLNQNNHLLDQNNDFNLEIPNHKNWQFEIIQKFVADKNAILTLYTDDSDYTGFIVKSDEHHTVINCVGNEGHDEFFSLIKNEDVTKITVNDLDSRKRLLLYNWRKNKL